MEGCVIIPPIKPMLHVALRFITAVSKFCCRGSSDRCDLGQIRARTLPENNRDMPHPIQPMVRGILEMSRTLCAAAAALLLAAMRISAHHAFAAEYDENKRVTVSGTVTRFEWTNPHAWLYVDGKNESDNVTIWSFEMGSPNGLLRRGWRRTELKKGDQVTVEGYRAKDGSNVANAGTITMSDGRKLFGGFQATPGAPGK